MMKNKFKILKYSNLLILFLLLTSSVIAQIWDVPEDKKAVLSPFKFDDVSRKQGEILFQRNCISCHGEPGKGNFVKINPEPGDMVSEKFSKLKDGEFFYKMSNGRGPMPRFMDRLKETERWQIISFIRTFHKGYVQKVRPNEKDKNKTEIFLSLKKGEDTNFIAKSYSLKGTDTIEFPNVELLLFAKRYFGNLQLGESKTTNKNGIAIFQINSNFPADTSGNISLLVKPVNQELYGDAETQLTIKYGLKNTNEPLNKKRAIWNTVEKAPLWILFTFLFGVLAVWSVIIYICFQLFKFKRESLKK